MSSAARPRIVVVGAGFGGLSLARELRKAPVDVLVLDRNNYHGFWPLLYQVATGILETQEIAYPVRSLLRKHENVDFRLADVQSVDLDARHVVTDRETVSYDYLVLAGGSTTNFFGNADLAEHAFGLKTVDDADQLRNHILSAVEAAARAEDPALRDALLTFVIVGGGPTGVELAGQLSLLLRRTLRREFPNLDLGRARVLLVNAGDGVLESFPANLKEYGRRQLEKLGVELRLNQVVRSVDDGIVHFGDGSQVGATTVVWAAGVRAADVAGTLGVETARGGTIPVTTTLNLAARPEVFVIGDMAYLEGYGDDGGAYPGVAQVAIQQGRQAAKNIVARESGRPLGEFRYFDKGQMAIIGRRSAVVDGFGVKLRGVVAWLAWLGLHILYLRGFRNRLVVMLDWFAAYLSPTRGAGVITRPDAHDRIARIQERVLGADAERNRRAA
jgi:NADH:ubiquinone reductase (H+-translocating)